MILLGHIQSYLVIMKANNAVVLIGDEGQLYFIDVNVTRIDCEPVRQVWPMNKYQCFVALTFTNRYILILHQWTMYIDDTLAKLGDDFVVQDKIIWAWKDGILKAIYDPLDGQIFELPCDKPISVYADMFFCIVVTETEMHFSHLSFTEAFYRAARNISFPVGNIISCQVRGNAFVILDTTCVHIIKDNKIKTIKVDNAVAIIKNRIICSDGGIICFSGSKLSSLDMNVTGVERLLGKNLFYHENKLVLENSNTLEYESNIIKLLTYSDKFVVVLEDYSVRFGRIVGEKIYYKQESFYQKLMRPPTMTKNARKI